MTLDLSALNDAQRAAVEHTDGPLLVLAGAGSGKTRTLTYRLVRMLEQGACSPHSLLAITFTRKAAWEMRRRLEELVGRPAEDITVTTFHSFGFKLLSAEGGALGFKPDKLKVLGGAEAHRLLARAMKDVGLDPARWQFDDIARTIERAKDNCYTPRAFVQVAGDFFQESIARVYTRYAELLREKNAVDYGDLIRLAVEALQQKDTLEFYQNLFRYVSVDEFQDTSFAQYQLVRHLVWQHKNVVCVGSPTQTIYSWRGADINNILNRFRQDFPAAPTVVLRDNYRSTATILDAAQAVVRNLPYHEELRAVAVTDGPPCPISLVALSDDWNEANFIRAEIERLVNEHGYRHEDLAVLYRTRQQGRLLEQALMKHDVPYTLIGDSKFLERKEIRDIIAYLRLCYDIMDSDALQRIINVPPRGLGQTAVEKLQGQDDEFHCGALAGLEDRSDVPPRTREAARAFADLVYEDLAPAATTMPLVQFFDYLLDRTGYRAWVEQDPTAAPRLNNVRLLRTIVERYDIPRAQSQHPWALFLAEIATMGDDDLPIEQNGVTLATVHAVKGLEWPVVFIAGLEEQVFPHAKSLKTPAALEEEQRLVYVAMTRAMRELVLTWARTRSNGDGQAREHAPSRFLAAMPRELLERRRPDGTVRAAAQSTTPAINDGA